MSKEKQIQEYESKLLIDELSKMPPMVIATAYLHAINYTLYGEDVTEKWVIAAQNISALEKAYRKGYTDGYVDAKAERKWIPCVDGNEPKANAECWISTNAKYVRRASYAPKANNQPNGFIVTDGSFGFYEYGKFAKAWMPYTQEPEPYREEG